ncbi:hypothetical protein SFUMM280S_00014 [Streptomyces fumanus]
MIRYQAAARKYISTVEPAFWPMSWASLKRS